MYHVPCCLLFNRPMQLFVAMCLFSMPLVSHECHTHIRPVCLQHEDSLSHFVCTTSCRMRFLGKLVVLQCVSISHPITSCWIYVIGVSTAVEPWLYIACCTFGCVGFSLGEQYCVSSTAKQLAQEGPARQQLHGKEGMQCPNEDVNSVTDCHCQHTVTVFQPVKRYWPADSTCKVAKYCDVPSMA